MEASASGTDVAMISAMITPALLILASSSLLGSALVRMARVVDRTRWLASLVAEGGWEKLGISRLQLMSWLERYGKRARRTEFSIASLYAAVALFVATCLAIAIDRSVGTAYSWLPTSLAMAGTALLFAGGALMALESRVSAKQIREEVTHAMKSLKEKTS